jgi:hypothetical protein
MQYIDWSIICSQIIYLQVKHSTANMCKSLLTVLLMICTYRLDGQLIEHVIATDVS